uniref:Uncharacterized protein n=1 Tax=Cajanus cajan TaxID=3821 RepID=A0A151TFT9_CAJCA|nr:hypothetical protein KK1_012174 [Cajanus cajan]
MVRVKTQIWNYITVCFFLSNLQCDAISLSKATSLPCTQYIEETAQTNYYKDLHRASSPTIS